MRKYWILFILISFIAMFSCTDDTSAYLSQDKEDVNVDEVPVDTTKKDTLLPEGQLVPGMHLVKLMVQQGDSLVERRFKYFMPVTLSPDKPISLIFEFHGSYEFDGPDEIADPLANISEANFLCQKAIKENIVICYPAGSVEISNEADTSGAVNWAGDGYTKSLPFVDAMVKYFTQDNEPRVDPNRIYSTGQSSGAIFSFTLALHRSDVFAAITPRVGQSASVEPFPSRAVPVRVFAGEIDDIVQHSAVLTNMTKWAREIGGYFESDMQIDTARYEGYADVTIRSWRGGKADYEIYSLAGIGHGINAGKCLDDMWEFMNSHPLNYNPANLFVSTNIKEIDAQCNQTFEISFNYSEGAEISIDAPQSWNPRIEGKKLTLTAPLDYFGNIEREGTITFTVTSNQATASCEIPFYLNAPKTYFEVGDIYYNEKFEPVGVVCWVNNKNIREAKIINLQEVTTQGSYQTINFGDFGTNFITPDYDDGENNTLLHVQQNATLSKPLNNIQSGLIWAAQYEYKGVGGWYLPAFNELQAISGKLTLINEKLQEIGGESVVNTNKLDAYLSSTVTDASGTKCFHMMNFTSNMEVTQVRENTSYYRARAFKKVIIK